MMALKAQWHVTTGLIPGSPMNEYTKAWQYTSQDYTNDGNKRGETYASKAKSAHDYGSALETGGMNWVKVEYIWL